MSHPTIIPRDADAVSAGVETCDTLRATAWRAEELPVGTLIDRYCIEGRLGGGTMGVVYAARDTRLGRRVAIKILRPAIEPNTEMFRELCQRLVREARAMASLSHPNLVAVHDIGTFGGRDFIVMDFVEGCTLREWAATDRAWPERLDVLLAAGRGLAEAHAAGIVHRDFKPDNVLVSRKGRAQVSDFGLARGVAGLPAIARANWDASAPGAAIDLPAAITQLGTAIGTPLYMAPELHRGEVADERSDQFAYAVTVWEVLYDRHPFPGRTVLELADAVHAGDIIPPPPASRTPLDFTKVLGRGLLSERADRWPSMPDLLDALERSAARLRRAGLAGLLRRTAIRRG